LAVVRVLIVIALLLGLAHASQSVEVVDACGNKDFVDTHNPPETPKEKAEREKWMGRVVFSRVRIVGAQLPISVLTQIREELRNHKYRGIYSRGEIQERALDQFQTLGYFKVRITPEFKLISGSKCFHRASVRFHVEQGIQYRLGKIDFTKSIFPPEELRKLFPMEDGKIFDTSKVRAGLENLRRKYDNNGYINFVAVPDVRIREEEKVVDLNIDLDAGTQFHVRQLGVAGLTDERFQQFYAVFPLKEGSVFDSEAFEHFFHEHPEFVPRNFTIETDTITKQDPTTSTVDLRIDLSGYHIKWPDMN